MDLVNLTHEALHRYFTRLFQSGYMKYSNVKSLIVLLYIQEIVKEYDLEDRKSTRLNSSHTS